MGLIEIRNRSERLGNLGGVREADMGTGAARAYAGMADAAAQDGRANRALAGGVAGLLDGAKKLALDFAAAQERRAKEEADRYVSRFQEGMNAYENGYTDAEGNRMPGAMEATPDDTGAWMDANVDYRDRFGARLRDELKMSDRAMEIARKRLVGYNLSAQNRWANRAASLDQARRKADGIARENAATEALMQLDGAGDDAARLCWQEWKDAGENSLEIAGIPKDSPAAKELLRKRALALLGRRLEARIAATAESVADLPPDRAKAEFDRLAGELAEDNIVAALAPDAEFGDGKGGVVAEYMREALGDAPISDFAKAAGKDAELARTRAINAAEAREREMIGEIANFSANALARGGIDDLEGALGTMNARAAQLPKGSRLETIALQEAKRLDKAADAEAKRLTWDAIIDHAADSTKWEPPKDSRMAKFYKALKESFDRQAQAYMAEGALMADTAEKEMFKANEAQLRTALLGAGASSPGVVAGQLAQAAANGHITLDQYSRLRKEHEKVWSKEGMPDKAAAMVQILKDEFFSGGDYDPTATMGVNAKTGKFEYLKDSATNKPYPGQNAEWEVEELVKGEAPSGLMAAFAPGTAFATSRERSVWHKRTLTSDEQLRLLDWAMELAQHDGEKTFVHPRTGERLDKPFVLDAAAEFREACREISTRKDAEEAQGRIVQYAGALSEIKEGAAKRERLLADAVSSAMAERSKAKSALRQEKRRPFSPKMPRVEAAED